MTRPARGFTLVELLVVVSIIALLITIIMPTYTKVMAIARETDCLNNLNLIAKALAGYMDDETNGDRLPRNDPPGVTYEDVDPNDLLPGRDSTMRWWCNKVYPYSDMRAKVFMCPMDSDREDWATVACSYGFNQTLTDNKCYTLHGIKDFQTTILIGHCSDDVLAGEPGINEDIGKDPTFWPGLHMKKYDSAAGMETGRCGFIMASGNVRTLYFGDVDSEEERKILFYP